MECNVRSHPSPLILFTGLMILGATLGAEPVGPSFFRDAPRFPEGWQALGALSAWVAGDHVLNQMDSPWFGHDLETGAEFTLVSSDWFGLRLGALETFQFRVHPESAWLLWARGLLTNLWLGVDLRLPWPPEEPIVLSLDYRHDCKHDIETFLGRTAVHDTLGLSACQALSPLVLAKDLSMGLDARLGAELFLGQVFQSLTPEPFQAKLFGELRWVPLSYQGWLRLFVEGRLAPILAGTGTAVEEVSGWQLDGRFNMGIEVLAGIGRVRLWWYVEHISDPWIDNRPQPATIQGLGLAFISVPAGLNPPKD